MCYLVAKDTEKTISRPTAYGEYAPYTFAKDEQEFKTLVRAMGT